MVDHQTTSGLWGSLCTGAQPTRSKGIAGQACCRRVYLVDVIERNMCCRVKRVSQMERITQRLTRQVGCVCRLRVKQGPVGILVSSHGARRVWRRRRRRRLWNKRRKVEGSRPQRGRQQRAVSRV